MQDHTMTEQERRDVEFEQLRASVNKIIAETRDINSQSFWRPVIVVGGILAVLNIGDVFNTILLPLLGQ